MRSLNNIVIKIFSILSAVIFAVLTVGLHICNKARATQDCSNGICSVNNNSDIDDGSLQQSTSSREKTNVSEQELKQIWQILTADKKHLEEATCQEPVYAKNTDVIFVGNPATGNHRFDHSTVF